LIIYIYIFDKKKDCFELQHVDDSLTVSHILIIGTASPAEEAAPFVFNGITNLNLFYVE